MLLEPVLVGHVALGGAGPVGERGAVPERRAVRRQDRPAHAGEAAHEEVADGLDDVMVGLEPGDEGRLAVGRDHLLEAHEGVHLVDVAMDALGHDPRGMDVGVRRVLEQARRGAQPPQQPVEQGEALGVGMRDDLARQRDEGLGAR